MPAFKPKSTKNIKINRKKMTTLDGTHREFMNEFAKDEYSNIPKLKQKRKELLKQLEEQSSKPIEQILDLKDQIQEMDTKIKSIKQKKKEYLLDNSKYVFEYFENKKNISQCDEPRPKHNLINSFFKIKEDTDNSVATKQSQSIVQKYLSNVDERFLDVSAFVQQVGTCEQCRKGEMIPLDDEGVLITNNKIKDEGAPRIQFPPNLFNFDHHYDKDLVPLKDWQK